MPEGRLKTDTPVGRMLRNHVARCAPALMLLIGCGGEQGGPGGGFAMPPTVVEVATIAPNRVVENFEAVGTIEAVASVTIVSEIDGAITRLPFDEGAPIRRGSLIARLDDAQLAAEVARSKAVVDQSRTAFERVKQVVEQNAGAPQDLDDAAAALKVAEANLALAEARFAKTRITAPFEGIIGARRVSVGAFLRAGQAITDLAHIADIRVRFSAPERYLARLRRGAIVRVTTSAYPGETSEGKIIVVEPILDATTRSAGIVAQLKNPGGKLRPGMSANVSAILSERDQALTVPSEAIFASGNQSFVFTVNDDSTVVRTPVELGTRLSDIVEVKSGVAAGTRVVRAGHQKLFEGAKIMPVTSQGGPPAGN